VEYVRYSSYSEAVAYPASDVNMDGQVNTTDQSDWNSGTPTGAYALGGDSDLNRDNVVDAADTTFFNASYTANTATGGKGRMSSLSVANRKGYAGYEFDEAASVYHVLHRVYLPERGRWSRRDPLGYVDVSSLYEYVETSPLTATDALGLIPVPCLRAEPTILPDPPANFVDNTSTSFSILRNSWQVHVHGKRTDFYMYAEGTPIGGSIQGNISFFCETTSGPDCLRLKLSASPSQIEQKKSKLGFTHFIRAEATRDPERQDIMYVKYVAGAAAKPRVNITFTLNFTPFFELSWNPPDVEDVETSSSGIIYQCKCCAWLYAGEVRNECVTDRSTPFE
jgi:RHS repeat-associated protein